MGNFDTGQGIYNDKPQPASGVLSQRGYDNAYAAGQINSTREQKQSPVDEALDRLAKTVEVLGMESSGMIERLLPVSQSVPAKEKTSSGVSHGSSCRIEERINDITERLRTISIALGNTREGLCI